MGSISEATDSSDSNGSIPKVIVCTTEVSSGDGVKINQNGGHYQRGKSYDVSHKADVGRLATSERTQKRKFQKYQLLKWTMYNITIMDL